MSWTIRRDLGGFPIRWSESYAEKWLAEGYWRDETLADIALRQTQTDPEKILLIEGERPYSRAEIYNSALCLAGYFSSQGAKPGDVVAFQLPNWAESAIIALAARMLGLVINPIPPIYRETELSYMLAATKAKFLFIPEQFRKCDYPKMVAAVAPELSELKKVVVVRGEIDTELSLPQTTWLDVVTSEPVSLLPKINPANAFLVMFTSGTTGKAKGVIQTHYGFGYKARQMVEAWGVGANDVIFMPSPVTHITGAIWAFDIPWISGASAVLLDIWNVVDGINAIRSHGCTISGGATPFLQQLLAATTDDRAALASLRTFFCGGTSVSPELIKRVSEEFPNCLFFRAYGSTEMMTVTLGIDNKFLADYGAETDGIVKPPMQVKLIDSEGNEITEDGVEGEIFAFGPEQFVGYLDTENNIGAFDQADFFDMGDLGQWRDGNYLTITGRKKDIIIRSGENISPKEVEDLLMEHPAVAEVAIVAMPSAATGEMGCAFVILNKGEYFSREEMVSFLNGAGLAKQKFPEWLEIVDDLPRVPSGKVRKDVLRIEAKEIAEKLTRVSHD
ncbi:AMP-binding protein [Halioxenophilus sp. WMMB6]|uniref:AMP-binding protein n=1 Tax=Halioxenophilus sp. WMMB6 TaxID=3073815 RepID=UPI00295E72D5|nr:AMP-binding protein [Halioxenophilus sp. WMMB6]